jgi:hypothetical protein
MEPFKKSVKIVQEQQLRAATGALPEMIRTLTERADIRACTQPLESLPDTDTVMRFSCYDLRADRRMTRADGYRAHAAECEQQAARAFDPKIGKQLEDIAVQWRLLAATVEQLDGRAVLSMSR